jgi:ankyrin repeat protein
MIKESKMVDGLENNPRPDTPKESRLLSLRLADAVEAKDVEACKSLLAAGADPDGDAIVPAHVLLTRAIFLRFHEGVSLLLEAGANVNRVAPLLEIPLCVAALNGQSDLCKTLISKGADVTARDSNKSTPLHWAAARGHIDACKLLIDAGAPVNAVDDFNHTPLHDAALVRKPHVIELCDLLLAAGANSSYIPPAAAPDYLTAFQLTVSQSRVKTARHFLEACREDPLQLTGAGATLESIALGTSVKQLLRAAVTERRIANEIPAVEPSSHSQSATTKIKHFEVL